MRAIGITT